MLSNSTSGLFDYLPDRWAIATLREVRSLLALMVDVRKR
jgi:hypothetical protein